MIVFLFLGSCMGLLFGCGLALLIGQTPAIEKRTTPLPNPAVRTVTVTIDPKRKDELFTQMQGFADNQHYAVLIAPTDSSENAYIVKLYRIDMKMTGSYSAKSGVLELDFYNTSPNAQSPSWFFDDELKVLEKIINKIPNSTYSVK